MRTQAGRGAGQGAGQHTSLWSTDRTDRTDSLPRQPTLTATVFLQSAVKVPSPGVGAPSLGNVENVSAPALVSGLGGRQGLHGGERGDGVPGPHEGGEGGVGCVTASPPGRPHGPDLAVCYSIGRVDHASHLVLKLVSSETLTDSQ